jgi:3-methyladenine DNA glycosylase Tag
MPAGAPPKQARPRALSGYLEALAHAMFQAGISWRVVESKWPGIKDALRGFDPEWLAGLGPQDVDALMEDKRLIRNRAKLESLVDNAQAMLELDAEHKGFGRYLRSLGDYDSKAAELKRQFRFLGDTGAYYFLYVVGEEVPPHDQWSARRAGR